LEEFLNGSEGSRCRTLHFEDTTRFSHILGAVPRERSERQGRLAKQGIAKPRGNAVDRNSLEKHVRGEDVDSGVTSWTPDRKQAKRFSGEDGIILEVDADSVSDRIVERPNIGKYAEEKEVLLKGLIQGVPTIP